MKQKMIAQKKKNILWSLTINDIMLGHYNMFWFHAVHEEFWMITGWNEQSNSIRVKATVLEMEIITLFIQMDMKFTRVI